MKLKSVLAVLFCSWCIGELFCPGRGEGRMHPASGRGGARGTPQAQRRQKKVEAARQNSEVVPPGTAPAAREDQSAAEQLAGAPNNFAVDELWQDGSRRSRTPSPILPLGAASAGAACAESSAGSLASTPMAGSPEPPSPVVEAAGADGALGVWQGMPLDRFDSADESVCEEEEEVASSRSHSPVQQVVISEDAVRPEASTAAIITAAAKMRARSASVPTTPQEERDGSPSSTSSAPPAQLASPAQVDNIRDPGVKDRTSPPAPLPMPSPPGAALASAHAAQPSTGAQDEGAVEGPPIWSGSNGSTASPRSADDTVPMPPRSEDGQESKSQFPPPPQPLKQWSKLKIGSVAVAAIAGSIVLYKLVKSYFFAPRPMPANWWDDDDSAGQALDKDQAAQNVEAEEVAAGQATEHSLIEDDEQVRMHEFLQAMLAVEDEPQGQAAESCVERRTPDAPTTVFDSNTPGPFDGV